MRISSHAMDRLEQVSRSREMGHFRKERVAISLELGDFCIARVQLLLQAARRLLLGAHCIFVPRGGTPREVSLGGTLRWELGERTASSRP